LKKYVGKYTRRAVEADVVNNHLFELVFVFRELKV